MKTASFKPRRTIKTIHLLGDITDFVGGEKHAPILLVISLILVLGIQRVYPKVPIIVAGYEGRLLLFF
jgi:hypothetical protein